MPGAKLLFVDKCTEAAMEQHVRELCQEIVTAVRGENRISILGRSQQREDSVKIVDATPFQQLMIKVLAVNRFGCTAVYTEPGVGKSIGALRALPAGTVSKNYIVLLDGNFREELKRFFRVNSFELVIPVAKQLFAALQLSQTSINMVIDNAVERVGDFDASEVAWIPLMKSAYECGPLDSDH